MNFYVFVFVLLLLFLTQIAPLIAVEALPDHWEILQKRFDATTASWNVSQIDAGVSNFIWAIDFEGKSHVKHGLNNEWTQLNDLQGFSLRWVSSGLAGVWGITKDYGIPVFRTGISINNPIGTEWLEVEGRAFEIIESGLTGDVYGLTRYGKLYYRAGITESKLWGDSWREIWGTYRFVSAGTYGVWAIDHYGRLYFGKGRSRSLSKFTSWQRVGDIPNNSGVKSVVAGFDGSVWALSQFGDVFRRKSVNILNPAGLSFWQKIDGLKLAKITAGLPGVIGITDRNEVLAFQDRQCGGLLVSSSGVFSTPNFPNSYPNNSVCLWVIKVDKAKQIQVNIDQLDLASNKKDFLAFQEHGVPVTARRERPTLVTSSESLDLTFAGNTALFEFISDGSIAAKGFIARYTTDRVKKATTTKLPTTTPRSVTTTSAQGCGGSIYRDSGELSSPNYPSNYGNSLNCKWIITAKPGKTIQVVFTDVSVEADGLCGYDYVEVGNGAVVGENSRKRLCGELRNQRFTSTANQIWIRFYTDSGVTKRGFKAHWSTGQLLPTTKKAPITRKPTTPSTTADDLPNGWRYVSTPSQSFKQVATGITEDIWALSTNGRPFILRKGTWIGVTDRPFKQITSGEAGTWAITDDDRAVYRDGSKWSQPGSTRFKMVDSGPHGFVLGVTNNNDLVYRDGISKQSPFGTAWKSLGKSFDSVSIGSYGIWGVDGIGDVYFVERPAKITAGIPLTWYRVPGLRLKQVDAGFGDNVYGVAQNGELYRRVGITHDKPQGDAWQRENANLKSVTTGLKGLFGIAGSDRIVQKISQPTQCGGILTAKSGEIKSPGFPFTYPQTAHCLWLIKVPSARSIRISIDSFNVNPSQGCKDDHVIFFKRGFYLPRDGVDKYCGRRTDFTRNQFDGGEVWVLFQASALDQRSSSGFQLRYSADIGDLTTRPTIPVTTTSTTMSTAPSTSLHTTPSASITGCGGSFSRNYGSFSSPGFPNLYQNSLRCIWTITVSPDRSIRLSFDDFAVEEDITCRFDFVKVKTSSQNGLDLGKFCGSTRPRDISVNGNKLWILFKSDTSEQKRGFRVTWSSKPRVDQIARSTTKPRTTSSHVKPRVSTTAKAIIKPTTAPQIPVGWSKIFSDIAFAHIDGGISPNAWAVNQRGDTFFQEGNNWRLVSGTPMKWVTSGESGVWAIDAAGNAYYRQGVAPLAPMGAYWDGVNGPKLTRIDSGPRGVLIAVDDGNYLLVREGISLRNPKGTSWRQIGTGYKHLSAGTYGLWAVDLNNQAYFSTMSSVDPFARPRWTPVSGRFNQVKAGYGGSLWAVTPDGQLYRRKGVTAITPSGLDWEKIGNMKVNGVSSGMSGVFSTLRGTNELIKSPDRRCGDIMTKVGGTFTSPSYPLNYPPDTHCLWQIKVPGAKKIIVDFQGFELEGGGAASGGAGSARRCNKDYLLYLQDGRYPSSYAVKKRCGFDASPIIFEGDKAWIEFVSDSSNSFSGFSARYQAVFSPIPPTDIPLTERVEPTTAFVTTPAIDPRVHTACDGTIDATVRSSGYFAHPGYPGTYKTYDVCRYVIKTSNNKKINLEFDLFDLEAGGQCVYDYLQIHDGNNRQGTLLGKFCGTTKPAAIKSTGDSLYVEFVSDSSTVRPGFLAKWSIIEDRIVTTTKIPTTVTTTKKVPEGPTAGKIRTACGGNIDAKTKSSGLFAHPSYPSRYRNKVVCNYVIQTTPDKTISLTFDKLNLEPSISCQYDFIEVRDGKDLNGRLLGKFCGSRIPASVTSTRDYLYVRFFTDDTTGGEGFVATWKTDIGNTVATIPPSTVCGNVFAKNRGSFASPGYPQNYPPGKDCAWVITVAPGKVIQLSFDFFSIEPSDSCEYDFIEVFDGATDSAKRLGRYCSKMPGEILSSGSKMRIRLRTDTSKNYKGFVARWAAQDPPSAPTTMSHTTISKPCFQRISGIGGEIHRGGRFSYYQPNQDCVWIITVSEGKRVRLSFVFLDLEDSPYCSKDLLIILDGPSDISRAIGRYCGRKQIGDIVSSGNQVYLRFKSDSHNQRRGFQLRWSAANPVTLKPTPKPTPKPTTQPQRYGVDICTGVLSGQSGYIVSPNYPGNYPLDRSCRKTIRSPPGTRIVLSFPDFSLESSTNCFGDVLAILDGDAPSAPNLANLCGSNVVPEIKSTGNAVFIEFVSDYSRTDRGFRLHWKSELLPQTVAPTQQATRMPTTTQEGFPEAPDCGGKLFGSSGRLQSPQLSRRYPYGITCVWIIETGRSTAIDIRLGSFDTGSKDCTGSYLLLRDGMSSYGRKIAKLCNTDAGRRVTSAGNMMYIEYRMDPNFNGRGFDLTWNERTLDKSQAFRCGGIKTRASGSISHVARRGDLANDVFCTWNIVAPTGSKIRLNVARLELEDDIGCTRDSLVIRDGFSSESKLIGKYCGSKVLLPVTSTGNSLFIELKTDCRSSKGIAFVGSWQRVRGERVPVTVITSEITVPQKPTTSPHVIQTTVAAKTSTVKHEGANQGTQQPQPTIAESNLNSRGGLLTGISGVIRSPQFPNKYPANQDIVWVIKGPSNGRIALNFRQFDLEDDSGCRYDYVHLRDGSAADSPTIGRFCGNHIPATYTSANNALWVRFFADNSDSASGFEAVWRWIKDTNELPAQTVNILETKPVCGGTLNGKSGEISSPNYPQYYPANKECIWIIRPKEYSAISLQFKSMRMEPEARCGYDFVEVRNGDSSTSPLLGRFCGSSLPDVQTSTRGAFWVRFKSDSSSNYRGFSASWKAGISNSPRARRSINGNIDKPGCGQAFSGTNGTLALSPPTKGDWKPKPTSCQWTIKSHDHKTIALHIRELGFKGPDSCDKNYMDIRVEHGDEGKLELFTRLCPSDAPKWYNSLSIPTGSRRVVVDYALESRGLAREPLRVVWNTLDSESDINPTAFPLDGRTTGCEERLTKPYGTISSPNYPLHYSIKTACLWIVTLEDPHSVITLRFNAFGLEGHPQCRYDYLLIRDGDSDAAPIIGKYCGNSLPTSIRSSSNRLWLRFYSDSFFTEKGFHLSYSKTKKPEESLPENTSLLPSPTPVSCGGQLSGDSGQIQTPGYPTRYPNSVQCVWVIGSEDPQASVSFSFEALQLEDTPQCQYDFVQIEDISNSQTKVLGKFCGRDVPLTDFVGKKLRLAFTSDASSSETGFKGNWKRVSDNDEKLKKQVCGERQHGVVGFIRSTNFPENYRDNERCEWKISALQRSTKIQLRFSEFNLEPSVDCEYDYIEIFDGHSREDHSLGKFCGQNVPDLIESTGERMLVVFTSDNADTRSGFEMVWVAVYKNLISNADILKRPVRVPDTNSVSCGGLFNSERGVIKTPNYPRNYPPNTLCIWIIKSNDTTREIKLIFKSFELEKHSQCKYDSLLIKDGSKPSSKVIKQQCGDEVPLSVTSTGNALWIQFKSDGTKQFKGFEASWQRVYKPGLAECGSRFTSPTGQLTSPNYPLPSTSRKFCTWIIHAPRGSKIKLTFKDINMRQTSGCSHGYVQVFDGDSVVHPELGRFCQSFMPLPITSSGSKLMVGFQSDGSPKSRGFKAEWMFIKTRTVSPKVPFFSACGSTLTVESGNIVLPPSTTSCTWLIRPASSKRITLSVVKANLISNPDCNSQALEIRNGFTSVAPLLLKICGTLQPRTVKSFTGALRVTYKAAGVSSNAHVHLYWTTSSAGPKQDVASHASCGVVRVPTKTFTGDKALVTSGSLPWMAALLSGSSSINCGAAILSSSWAITAAHCFKRLPFYAFRKVMVGELNLLETEGTEQELRIKFVHIHPGYNSSTNENDIALISLGGKVAFNDRVNTICLPGSTTPTTQLRPGTVCSTAGWGTTRYLGRPSKPLVLVRLPLVSTDTCNGTNAYRGTIKDGMLCAGRSRGGLDTCQGDGGGPLTCEIRPGKHVLVGISSWGSGCANPNKYGVYTDVRKYLSWIKGIIEA
eukprot:gene3627-4141_t